MGDKSVYFSRIIKAIFSGSAKGHFGQWSEDVLVRKLFPKNKKDGIYLDVGAYHPFTHSNTAYFWMKGWRGFNIDANPNTIRLFNSARPKDCNIWSAIIPKADVDRGVHEVSLLLPKKLDGNKGTSASGTVHSSVGQERGLASKQMVPAKSIEKIIEKYNIGKVDYLNVDIEGYDEAILKEMDLSILCPEVVSVEDYSNSLAELMESPITKWMETNHYVLVARAGPTSIFTKKS